MISEVNPLGGGEGELKEKSFVTVQQQSKNWYNIPLASNTFKDGLVELYNYSKEHNQKLILRDWPFINFNPHELNKFNPSNSFLSIEELKDHVEILPFAIIRDSIDIWISRGDKNLDNFYGPYEAFIKEIIKHKIKIFKYEDFCKDPEREIKVICQYINVPYNEGWKKYTEYTKANGDSQNKNSKGRQISIKSLNRKGLNINEIVALENCTAMKRCNKLMGYTPSYFNGLTSFPKTKFYTKRVRQFLGKIKRSLIN
jgi:hypothetical protein